MIRMTLAAALVVAATLASAGAASAFPQINPKFYPKLPPLGGKVVPQTEITSPGDPFYPQTASVDTRAECLANGGTPKRQFDGTEFVWTCRQ
jgi:hypothetical protein